MNHSGAANGHAVAFLLHSIQVMSVAADARHDLALALLYFLLLCFTQCLGAVWRGDSRLPHLDETAMCCWVQLHSCMQAAVTPFTHTAAFLHAITVPSHYSLQHATMRVAQAGVAMPKRGPCHYAISDVTLNTHNREAQHRYEGETR